MNSYQNDQGVNGSNIEPLPIEQRIRDPGNPAGLVNFGNACYFNSLVQALFHIPEFVEIVMTFNHEEERKKQGIPASPEAQSNDQNKAPEYRFRLLENFKFLFSRMIKSQKTYQNAKEVFNIIWESNKNSVQNKGDQMDISEFYMNFHKELFESFEPLQQEDKNTQEEEKKEDSKEEESKEEGKEDNKEEGDLEMKKNESALGDDMEVDGGQGKGFIWVDVIVGYR